MKVKDIMQTKVMSVKQGTTLNQLLNMFKDFHSFPVVPVVNNDNVLMGVVQIGSFFEIVKPQHQDLLMHNPLAMLRPEAENIFDVDIEEGMGFLVIATDIMDERVVKIEQDKELKEAYDLMNLHKREMIPVVDKNKKLVGIISIFDIVMKIFKEKGLV